MTKKGTPTPKQRMESLVGGYAEWLDGEIQAFEQFPPDLQDLRAALRAAGVLEITRQCRALYPQGVPDGGFPEPLQPAVQALLALAGKLTIAENPGLTESFGRLCTDEGRAAPLRLGPFLVSLDAATSHVVAWQRAGAVCLVTDTSGTANQHLVTLLKTLIIAPSFHTARVVLVPSTGTGSTNLVVFAASSGPEVTPDLLRQMLQQLLALTQVIELSVEAEEEARAGAEDEQDDEGDGDEEDGEGGEDEAS